MPPVRSPAVQSRLTAAVHSVALPALTIDNSSLATEPAQSRLNLPQPATAPPAQNEPTSSSPTRDILRRLLSAAVDPEECEILEACEDALEPAQTCHDLPEPAETHLTIAPAQNEPRFPTPLTPRQFHAARLLVAGHTAKSVAAHLGVNRHTVSEWKKNPDFQAEVQRVVQNPLRQPHYFAPG